MEKVSIKLLIYDHEIIELPMLKNSLKKHRNLPVKGLTLKIPRGKLKNTVFYR